MAIKAFLKTIYHGKGSEGQNWRWTFIGVDMLLMLFFVVTTFIDHDPMPRWLVITDYGIGTYLLLDWLARGWVSADRIRYLSRPLAMLDLLVILSLFAPALTESFIFLRVIRTLRLLHSYHLLHDLRQLSGFFRDREEIISAALNLLVFIFVASSTVYALQVRVNDNINNYVDAFYFTVSTLTTTGFGDITLPDTTGKIIAAFMMIIGVSLFLRLIQSIFRPSKVSHECPDCGLNRHDRDAVHCKHCGVTLHISTEGA
ncbi:MAG: ion transporter [Gammaproteobacteria bacterium]|nr:ion transporter [Gammaproteobacteria bacterium]